MSQGGFTKTALTLITTKGDLLTHSTIDTRLPVGADGTYLKADSSEPTGLIWAAGGGGGGGDVFLSGTPANNQLAVWTNATTIEGDSALTFDTTTDVLTAGTLNATTFTALEMVITDASKNLVSAAVATYPSLTELSYLKGATSSVQTQLNAKGTGTVTSVALSTPTGLTISGSPVTTTGTLAVALDTGYVIPLQSALDAKANSSGALTQFVGNGNYKVWYSDGSGDVTELALGVDGTFLKSNGAAVAPSFAVPAGSGDVSKVGTPVNNQIGVWTGDGTIEGDAALTFDTATDLLTTGILNATSLTASEIVLTDASKNLVSGAVATYPSLTELTYVKGVTSAIQTQLGNKQASDATLTALAAYNTNGLLTQTAADTFTGRTVTGTANEISVSNGDGVSGNPTLSLPATIDLGGKTSFEIPNSAAPTVDADGEIAVDTTVADFSHGLIKYFSGEELVVVSMPIAQFTSPTNNYVVAYDSTADEFQLKVGGSGAMPNVVVGGLASAHDVNTTTAFAPITYRDFGSLEMNVRAFDTTTTEYMQGFFKVPTNLGTGNVTFRIMGSASTAVASKNVKFTFDFIQAANSDLLTGAYGSSEVWDDQAISGTQDDLDIISNTETVANLGWVAGRMVFYRLYRSTATTNNLGSDYHVISFYIDIPQA